VTTQSPADQTADQLDKFGDDVHAYATQYGVEPDGRAAMLAHVTVPLPAHLVLRLWHLARTASRQLRVLSEISRAQADRVRQLEAANGAQAVELAALRGSESDRLEALSRWVIEFAAENGVEPAELPALVAAQREHDSALWAHLDRERQALEQYRLAVFSVTEQLRDSGALRTGLEKRGVTVILQGLERAYRRSRLG